MLLLDVMHLLGKKNNPKLFQQEHFTVFCYQTVLLSPPPSISDGGNQLHTLTVAL